MLQLEQGCQTYVLEAGTCKLRADWDIHLTLNICAVYVWPLMWLLLTTVGPHETDLDYFRNWKVRVRSFMIPFHRKLFCYWRKYKATYSCSLTHRDNSTHLSWQTLLMQPPSHLCLLLKSWSWAMLVSNNANNEKRKVFQKTFVHWFFICCLHESQGRQSKQRCPNWPPPQPVVSCLQIFRL